MNLQWFVNDLHQNKKLREKSGKYPMLYKYELKMFIKIKFDYFFSFPIIWTI